MSIISLNDVPIIFKRIFFYICISTFFIGSDILYANEVNISYLCCNIYLSKYKILSGEPVNLCFTFKNISDGLVYVYLGDCYDIYEKNSLERTETEELKVSVRDSKGNEIPRTQVLCRPHSQTVIISKTLHAGESATIEYPLHLRISTEVEPGKYNVLLNAFDLVHGFLPIEYKNSDKLEDKVMKTKRETFSGPSFLLEVHAFNKDSLNYLYNDVYNKALFEINHPKRSFCGNDFSDIQTNIRTILWANGPMAVPYQIELIYSKEKGFIFNPSTIVNTWSNIFRYATFEQIERVIEMAERLECEKDPLKEYTRYYTSGLAWAIHQWHANGSEEIKERTRELAEKLPDEDPCPQSMELGQYPYGKP